MALYYPPKQGFKGWRPEHWGGGVIPDNLANAIATATLVNKEPIHDSNTEWLIMDGNGNVPSKSNMHLQPESQLQRVNYYSITQKTGTGKPTTIKITESAGTYTDPYFIPQTNWFMQNWKWLVPVGIGLVILSIPSKSYE